MLLLQVKCISPISWEFPKNWSSDVEKMQLELVRKARDTTHPRSLHPPLNQPTMKLFLTAGLLVATAAFAAAAKCVGPSTDDGTDYECDAKAKTW